MPKKTFFNLAEEKRRLIEDTAITEFASCGFDKASINTIVRNSGISKGSFYQYFTDKKDLFIHLIISVAAVRKLEHMSPVLKNPEEHDFFTIIKELFLSGLRFAGENPELEKLGMWLTNNTSHSVYEDVMEKAGKSAADIYEELVSKAAARGEFKDGIDGRYISHIFPALLASTMDYCLISSKGKKKNGISEISDEIMDKVDLMIDLIRDGIGRKQFLKE